MADKTFWPNYLFFTDFSSEAVALAAIPAGVLSDGDATMLAATLSAHDTGEARAQWTAEADQPYTLAGATVVFSGANHTNMPSNALFSQVLIVQLPWADAPSNLLVLQYNPPMN